jgi:hypothetical protein
MKLQLTSFMGRALGVMAFWQREVNRCRNYCGVTPTSDPRGFAVLYLLSQ